MSEPKPIDQNAPVAAEEDAQLIEGMRLLREAQEKRHRLSSLGTTYAEEKRLGSPPFLLKSNPGKTLGELLSDEEILSRIDSLAEFYQSTKTDLAADPHNYSAQDDLRYIQRELPAAINYLTSIGRLPEKYKSFQL